jgi:hypothetical protein
MADTFKCNACSLELNRHGALHATGLGGQFSVTEDEDP